MTMLGLVLVIDDERIFADSIAAYLEHHGFSAVEEAGAGTST